MRVLNELWNRLRLSWHLSVAKRAAENRNLLQSLQAARRNDEHAPLAGTDRALVGQLLRHTSDANTNNITRTQAYLGYYRRFPEIHWALLAHVVSRNGGWGMTDTKGEWFARVVGAAQCDEYFHLLERANWLIFQDAFPQLLLYEAGRKQGENLSRLLPYFGVSRFMLPIWDLFWVQRDSRLLTHALIVNEQNYIEGRVVRNPKYQAEVLSSIEFQAHTFLNLNQTIIPFIKGGTVRVAGTIVEQFHSLAERIRTGQRLYSILFHDRGPYKSMMDWISHVPHTGSRADYWPDFFSEQPNLRITEPYQPRFVGTPNGERRIYSPRLADVWPDVQHTPAEQGDWFKDLTMAVYLFERLQPDATEIDFTQTYFTSLQTVEHIISGKEAVQSIIR